MKNEDENIYKLRADTIIWALIVSCILMAAVSLLLNILKDKSIIMFTDMLLVSNAFTILILYNIKFHLAIRKLRKSARHEE